jgi:DnaJ-class molecular chaperone
MKMVGLLTVAVAGAAAVCVSCARMEKRSARYDQEQCPLCTVNPGVCAYCSGTGKCEYCDGTGTRTTRSGNFPEAGIKNVSYQEKCPFCGGGGVCSHCTASKKCWGCDGTGRVRDWSFLEKGSPRPLKQD